MKNEQYNELKAIVDSIENVDKELIDTKQLVLRINEIFGNPNYSGWFDNVDFNEMFRNNEFKKPQVLENLEIRYTGVDGMKFEVNDDPSKTNYTDIPNGYWGGETTNSTSCELQSIYATNNVEEDAI